MRHKMSNKDMALRTATCSICGPVKISKGGICRNSINETKRKARRRRGSKPIQRSGQKIVRDYVRKIKDAPCMDCGISYPYYVMDLDHRDPSRKLYTVAAMQKFPLEMVMDEIAKCDVVCSNCHRERTWGKGKRPRYGD